MGRVKGSSVVFRFDGCCAGANPVKRLLVWHSSSRSGSGLAETSCCFKGEGRAHSGSTLFSPCFSCLGGAAARLQVGTGVVLSGIPRDWAGSEVPEQPLPSNHSCTFSRELVADLQLLVSLLPSPLALV